jgi:hypothetical protein
MADHRMGCSFRITAIAEFENVQAGWRRTLFLAKRQASEETLETHPLDNVTVTYF